MMLSIVSSSRGMPISALVLAGWIVGAIFIDSVDSMVVTTAPKKAAAHSRALMENPKGEPNDLLRMLLEGPKGGKTSSSYSIDADSTATKDTTRKDGTSNAPRTSPLLDPWRDYEILRNTQLEEETLGPFFFESGWQRKQLVAQRFVTVLTTLKKTGDDWNKAQAQKEREENRKTPTNAKQADAEVSLKMPTNNDPAALRLCEHVASLGPLAVKIGQTLSQRPDIVGKDACNALKRLQTQNAPLENPLALAVLRESLNYWDGPLAENLEENENSTSDQRSLFRYVSKEPIASASLGQVYKATTWEGVDLALKVQRPEALSTIAVDVQCFRIVFALREIWIDWTEQWNTLLGKTVEAPGTPETGMTEEQVRAQGDEGTIASVIDRVARDIMREMDYRIEAANSYKFKESLSFLGFVDTPEVLLATDKVLATRFVNGHHLGNLNNPRQELALTRMAVEACTASMVLTGFVHADPHEGNMMYSVDDGKIVFLDFGLMSDVDQNVMEAFARGIQALLSEDFVSVTEAFADTGFVTTPVMHRDSLEDLWRTDPRYGLYELADQLEHDMKTTEGGLSRFGALATVLNKKISPNWLVFTPPYVLLLIRTFLTLEGIAAQVDPDFNIYEMSMPWAVRRFLSPSTEKGQQVLRNTILKENNTIQWERVMELMEMQKAATAAGDTNAAEPALATEDSFSSVAATEATSSTTSQALVASPPESKKKATTVPAARTPEEKKRKQKEYAVAQQAAMKDAIGTLLGSTNGRALRGVLKDLDTPDLIWKLGSKEGRPIIKMGMEKALGRLFCGGATKVAKETDSNKSTDEATENYRPVSEACRELRNKQAKRTQQVTRYLIRRHTWKCLVGFKGMWGTIRLGASVLQIATALLVRNSLRKLASVPSALRRRSSISSTKETN